MAIAKETAILAMTPGADHSQKEGYFVKLSSGNPIVCTAATDVPFGIIIEGENTSGQDSIGVLGGNLPIVHVKTSGNVSKGNYLQLAADGSVVADVGSGARVIVGRAIEDGVSGELVQAIVFNPIVYAGE